MIPALSIFAGTYLVLALGRLPWFRIDRTGAAIIGASLMLAFNVLSVEEAYHAVDYNTLILLFGMMIVVANLRLSGFFALVTARVLRHLHRPFALLAAVTTVSGLFSAFFVNDTICLVLTPLVLEVVEAGQLNPVPFLLAVAMAANIGSVATITGNPQNMMIGAFSGIRYRDFAAALSPTAVVGLVVTFAMIAWTYRREFLGHKPVEITATKVRVHRGLLAKSLAVSLGMIVFFFLGWPVPKVALIAGALLLITRRVKPERVYLQIDWPLLVLFTGLFIVVAGAEKVLVTEGWMTRAMELPLGKPAVLGALTAVLSNIIGNVPAVLVLKPIVGQLGDPRAAWLMVAMASTLAGNLTIVGSVANLIVVQRARQDKVEITFWEYLKVGLPLGAVTILIGAVLLG